MGMEQGGRSRDVQKLFMAGIHMLLKSIVCQEKITELGL